MKRVKRRSVHDHNGETILYVHWSHLPAHSNESLHLVKRGEVRSDLAMEVSPDLTSEEMQTIMYHARRGVREVMLQRRRVGAKKAPPLRPSK